MVPGSTLDHVIFFADDGTAYTMRINEVPATSGYGEPITKFFKLGDQVKVVAAVTTDPRFTPPTSRRRATRPAGRTPGRGDAAATCCGRRWPPFRTESTKVGRRYVKLDEGDKVVMARLVGDETGVMLASRGGHVIHFPIDEVNILSGVGKGVIGHQARDDDECLGGVLVGGRFDKLVVETETGKTQEFGPGAIKSQNRGGKGDEAGRADAIRARGAAADRTGQLGRGRGQGEADQRQAVERPGDLFE